MSGISRTEKRLDNSNEYREQTLVVEPHGIEQIVASERHGRTRTLFSLWLSANMGLPVWMTAPSVQQSVYRAHVKWLYRLGRFFGWIDDAADLDDDRAAGRPNYFSAGLKRGVARRIAREGALILEVWNAGAPQGQYGRTLRETFLAVTWSWLGMHKTKR